MKITIPECGVPVARTKDSKKVLVKGRIAILIDYPITPEVVFERTRREKSTTTRMTR